MSSPPQRWPSTEDETDRAPVTGADSQHSGSRKQAKWAQCLRDSPDLHAAVASLRQQLFTLHPAEWVAAYFLLCLSFVNPRGFIGGKVSVSIDALEPAAFPPSQVWAREDQDGQEKRHEVGKGLPEAGSVRLCDVAGLVLVQRDLEKAGGAETPVLDVLRRFQLSGVPIFVNDCICNWAAGLRPLVLMDRVATAPELMAMQAEGRRCITCFCQSQELGQEYVDAYPPFAVKDALHFAIHDLQHMRLFVQPAHYCEQVGFLHQVQHVHAWLQTGGDGSNGGSLLIRDKELRHDFGHLISDMNSCSAHMLDFLLAKWWNAAGRLGQEASLARELTAMLDLLVGDELPGRARGDAPPPNNAFDAASVREFFHAVGCRRLAASVAAGGDIESLDTAAALMATRWPLGANR